MPLFYQQIIDSS